MVEEQRPPLAFMSYVRFDDEHENGRLTEFCKRLSGEVRIQTGDDFSIFQDRHDIQWGQNWKERIEESLDTITFLIPIITPGFFKSAACREELERFLAREHKLKRNDLIFPVYYVSSAVLDEDSKRAKDKLAQEIAKHQFADWRELRFEPLTSPQVGKTLAQLATQIFNALERIKVAAPIAHHVTSPALPSRGAGSTARDASESNEVPQRPSPKTEPPVHVVDSLHHGDYLSISEAIENAKPGDRILVRPGLYPEGLVIDKPLEIIGDGKRDDIVVQATSKDAVLFKATMGRVTNMTLRQVSGGDWCGVDIVQGRLMLEGCDISSQGRACVAIHEWADPRLRDNRIHNGKHFGVLVYENGQGTLEENDIWDNGQAGVKITTGGNPTLRKNIIHNNGTNGVLVGDDGQGMFEDNDIHSNAYAGVEICTGGNPVLRRNHIHHGNQNGVLVITNGRGTLEGNFIFDNNYGGVGIRSGGNPTLRRNHINNNGEHGVWVFEHGGGTLEDNDLRGNAQGAWIISDDSRLNLKCARNQE